MSALALPLLLGAIGLAVEVGNGYAERVGNQAIADTAALSAAEVYLLNKKKTEWEAAARETVAAAGLSPGTVETALVDSPDGSSAKAIKATVTTQQPYFFSRIFGVGTSFSIGATAYARLPGETAPCIVALAQDVEHGVWSARGSGISAPDCSIVSNDDVFAEGSSSISSKSISAHETIATPPNDSSITTALKIEGAKIVGDPLEGNSDIAAALSMLGTFTAVELPLIPSVPAVSVSVSNARFERVFWPTNGYVYRNGSTEIAATLEGDTWVFPAGTYDFDDLAINEKVAFNGPTTINVNGNITNIFPGITIRGDGMVNVGNDVRDVAGLTITGAGIVNVRRNVSFGGFGTGLVIQGPTELNVGGR